MRGDGSSSAWRAAAFASGIGVSLALLVVLGVWGGRWLDARLGTDPIFTVIGLLLGLGVGTVVLVRQAGRASGGDSPDASG